MNFQAVESYDFNKIATNYEVLQKGLRKEVLVFKFKSMIKPTEISKCLVLINNVTNLCDRESKYLSSGENIEFWIQLGEALTPIDYYIEILLQQMFENETSQCYIKTKSSDEIMFTIKLIRIDFRGYIFELKLKNNFDLAKQFKENGVLMFKKYPKFAQEYFCRGAKCLISYKPFDKLTEEDGITSGDLHKLLHNLQLNISACLIKEGRYEDVIFLTNFVEEATSENIKSDKAIYRRATALYKLKKFEEAKELIEKLETFKENSEILNLYKKVLNDWKADNLNYRNIIKKMFT